MAALFGLAVWFGQGLDQNYTALASSPRYVFRTPIMLWNVVGLMSYSIYLLHAKLYPLVAQFVRQVVPGYTFVFDLLVLSGTLDLCYRFYLCCEAPFFKPTEKKPEKPMAPSAA